MVPHGFDRPSNSTLDRSARLMFGENAPSIGTSRSRHSTSKLQGSKRKGKGVAGGVSVSSSTLAAQTISIPSDEVGPSATAAAAGSGGGIGIGSGSGSGSDTGIPLEGQGFVPAAAADEIIDVIDVDQDDSPTGKRAKKCTSDIWNFFTKKDEIIEINGNKYVQTWGYYNFPKCRAKYRAESNHGTIGFRNHLKSNHNIVKGQLQLKTEKDHGKDITAVQPFKYDQDVSLKKFYLATIMHEYPFNMVEHEYFVEFIKYLRPSFPIKLCVTFRKEIMDIFLAQKDKLYAYLKTVKSRFSATMDMWTSC